MPSVSTMIAFRVPALVRVRRARMPESSRHRPNCERLPVVASPTVARRLTQSRRPGMPATSSAPFVATLVDVTGLVIYFSIGFVVLRGTLL